MINLAVYDMPTRSSAGMLLRHIMPRMLPQALVGPMARKPFFDMVASSGDIIVGNGHGSSQVWSGQDEDFLWQVGNYDPAQTEGKVIYLLSCDTGQELGQDLVTTGRAKAFRGYNEDYLWVANPIYYFNPWDDPNAKTILKPAIMSIASLLDGATAQESLDIEREQCLKGMEDTNSELVFSLLKWNYDHSVLFGDGKATVRARRKAPPFPPPPLI